MALSALGEASHEEKALSDADVRAVELNI